MGSQSRFLSSFTIVRHLPHRFSSSPFSSSFASFTNWGIPESVAYLRSMRRPPSKVLSRMQRWTSCSFIGTLYNHVQCSRHSSDILRAFVSLEVKSDHRLPNSSCFTSVCLRMKGELAQISLQHLKPNDFIYVSGILASHQKFDASGEMQISYTVYVQDLNYVTRPAEPHRMPRPANLPEEMVGESGPIHEIPHLERMHLWQLFFASPNEWWDNRLGKKNPSFPDFKHKDTNECLWLSPDDPPWIRRHLEQYDASIRGGRSKRDANVLF
ncbi:hypothetical protein KSP39_PZI010686 [Platanthera zijinensis]|uniref:Protein OSB1, mitochondrial n=1 Tax=Platanthera zijinensis TaxID=2320716 RepID=A0AAP0BKH7_9ASPA